MTMLNPRAAEFTPSGLSALDRLAEAHPSPPSCYSIGPHCPWEIPVLPMPAHVAIADVTKRYAAEEAQHRNTGITLGHFDELLRIAAEYCFDNGALSVSPVLIDSPRPIQQICRVIASALVGIPSADASAITPEMRDASRQLTVVLPPTVLRPLMDACSPVASDEISPTADWELAFSCVGSMLHLLTVAAMFEKGILQGDPIAVERLAALRDAVLRHRGAPCLIKVALPLMAACRYAANCENAAKRPYAARWCRDMLPQALSFVFAMDPVGSLRDIVQFSLTHMWSDGSTLLPLGAVVLHETLQALSTMKRLSMGGLSTHVFNGISMMQASPVVYPRQNGSASDNKQAAIPSPEPALRQESPPAQATTPTVVATAPFIARDLSEVPPHLAALLEEVASHDPGVMLAFALATITECTSVSVATVKRAVEAVELACDGDCSQLDSAIARRPQQPQILDMLCVCKSVIKDDSSAHFAEHLRRASEGVLAREHGTAHASALIIRPIGAKSTTVTSPSLRREGVYPRTKLSPAPSSRPVVAGTRPRPPPTNADDYVGASWNMNTTNAVPPTWP